MKNKILIGTAAALALTMTAVSVPFTSSSDLMTAQAVTEAERLAQELGINVSGIVVPTGELSMGKPYSIGGAISSDYTILQVFGGIYAADGTTKIIYCEDSPSSTYYDLRTKFDNELAFNILPAGTYTYKIAVRTVQADVVVAESKFTVGGSAQAASSGTGISVSGKIVPTGDLQRGRGYSIGGVISSGSTISKVSGGVYSADGSTRILYCEDYPNATAYDLGRKFDNDITFNTLAAGNYLYKITAQNANGENVVAESKFTVGGGSQSSSAASANAAPTISGKIVPTGDLAKGSPCIIGGIINSGISINKVYGGIYTSDGKNAVLYCEDYPNTASYDLRKKFDNELTFNTLAIGNYVYRITAQTAKGETVVAESKFTVGGGSQNSSSPSNTTITISGKIAPTGNLAKGAPYIIGGIINSGVSIGKVYGGVYTSDGKNAVLYCEDYPNTASYDLRRKFDNELTFNTLPAGNYVYKITAQNAGGAITVVESPFTVGGGSQSSSSSSSNAGISVSGKIVPTGDLAKGSVCIIGGIINSGINISEVYGGVYSADGKSVLLYCEDYPNSTSYDLRRKFDNELTFNTLPAGNYIYKIIAKTAKGETVAAESKFTVGGGSQSSSSSSSGAGVSISGKILPTATIQKGSPCIIGGIINSGSNITKVYGGVYSAGGSTKFLYCEDYPNSTSYDLRRVFDNDLTFNTLEAGNYLYRITAKTASGETVVAETKFSVVR